MKNSFLSTWSKPILAIILVWIGIVSFWFTNTINDREHFTQTTVTVLQTERVRKVIAAELVGRIEAEFPVLVRVTGPTLNGIFTGALDSDLLSRAYQRVADAVFQRMTTGNSDAIAVQVGSTIEFLLPVLARQSPELAERLGQLPSEIIILPEGRVPDISLAANLLENVGRPLGILGLGFMLYLIWKAPTVEAKRTVGHQIAVVLASASIIIYILVGTIGSFIVSLADTETGTMFLRELLGVFTKDLSYTALVLTVVALASAILNHFLSTRQATIEHTTIDQ